MTVLPCVAPDTSPNAPSPALSKLLSQHCPLRLSSHHITELELQPNCFHSAPWMTWGYVSLALPSLVSCTWQGCTSQMRWDPIPLKVSFTWSNGKGFCLSTLAQPPTRGSDTPPLPPRLDSNDRLATWVSWARKGTEKRPRALRQALKVCGTGSRWALVYNECDSASPKHKKGTKLFGLSDNLIIQKWGKFLFLHLCTRDQPRWSMYIILGLKGTCELGEEEGCTPQLRKKRFREDSITSRRPQNQYMAVTFTLRPGPPHRPQSAHSSFSQLWPVFPPFPCLFPSE